MAKQPGYSMKIKVEGLTLLGIRSINRDFSTDMAEATSQDSTGRHKEYLPMYKDTTYSVEIVTDPAADGVSNVSKEELYTYMNNATKVTIYYGGVESGDKYWEQEGYFTSIGETNDYADVQTVSVEIQGTGQPSENTVS
jgi:hypothetical protein